jgi:hypothetical protein
MVDNLQGLGKSITEVDVTYTSRGNDLQLLMTEASRMVELRGSIGVMAINIKEPISEEVAGVMFVDPFYGYAENYERGQMIHTKHLVVTNEGLLNVDLFMKFSRIRDRIDKTWVKDGKMIGQWANQKWGRIDNIDPETLLALHFYGQLADCVAGKMESPTSLRLMKSVHNQGEYQLLFVQYGKEYKPFTTEAIEVPYDLQEVDAFLGQVNAKLQERIQIYKTQSDVVFKHTQNLNTLGSE